MSDTRERAGAAGVVVAGTFFKIVLYICVIVLLFWVGKASYQFGHDVFNQQAMSPGEGQEVTVVIKEDTSLYKIAKTLQKKVWSRVQRYFMFRRDCPLIMESFRPERIC
ncbi:MAG: hypothetical protein ACLUAL_08015 [Blautia wexlerae]